MTRAPVALAALAAALGACARARPAPPLDVPPGEAWVSQQQLADNGITVTTVAIEEVTGSVAAAGKVTFDDLRVAHVFSPVTGRVTRILAQPGMRVRKGDPLAQLSSPDVGTAFADLIKAQADLTAAEHERKRQQALVAAGAGARKDQEIAEDNYRKAQAEFLRAQQKTRLLRGGSVDRVTQEYTLRAPIPGEVIARTNLNPGTEVAGLYSGGNAVELFTIGELDVVWVVADVFEMDLPRVHRGAAVRVRVAAWPDRVFDGTIEWIADSLDPVSRTIKIRCSIPNPRRELRPEMYAAVTISTPGVRALAVPRTAVLRLGDQTAVFVEAGRAPTGQLRFRRRPVTVREDDGDGLVPVVAGLTAGERIAASGAILLAGAY